MKMEVGATKADNSRGCIIFCSTNFSFKDQVFCGFAPTIDDIPEARGS